MKEAFEIARIIQKSLKENFLNQRKGNYLVGERFPMRMNVLFNE